MCSLTQRMLLQIYLLQEEKLLHTHLESQVWCDDELGSARSFVCCSAKPPLRSASRLTLPGFITQRCRYHLLRKRPLKRSRYPPTFHRGALLCFSFNSFNQPVSSREREKKKEEHGFSANNHRFKPKSLATFRWKLSELLIVETFKKVTWLNRWVMNTHPPRLGL